MKIPPLGAEKPAVLTDRDIQSFRPAAIEIEQTPPSPLGRGILWAIIALFVIALLWACFGRIDIVATAQGKVIPSERVKTIQPLETAAVAEIHVREGQRVAAGDLLITLDTAITEADVRRLSQEWRDTALERRRLQALADWFEGGRQKPPVLEIDIPEFIPYLPKYQALLRQETAEIIANLNAMEREAARMQAEYRMTEVEITKNRRLLEVLNERVSAYELMQRKKLGPRMEYLEVKQSQIEVEQDIGIQEARLQQLEASLAANKAQQEALIHQQHKSTLQQLQEAQTREASLLEEKIKAEQRSKQYHLMAPIDGTVQQLAVHTIGGVVTPAQELMLIVPEQSELEVEAFILNKDIGFVQEGQTAEVKIDTFNFTKYGVIDAELINLSDDAVQDEKLGLIYKARLRLKQDGLSVEDKYVRLSPGMSVMAEVKTGQRRIIEFFLSPLLRYKKDSLQER
ncbi:HlyD family type I secretion periplasmic adaptor subunit [Microbulbifer thermotolerans]|uniref:HlyD family type I secretion periplasmic adaptor subunit n=1 Tax=Microbulbifer thermotolerans TaxID=252514 RepID=UPI002673A4E6|nr:HlyD family type I secretion periplasmic adaptor subunit [Microbulbifer thermotolerans]WKT60107.1 HlyD family type I secretion periplasmic adaptor subunit [Microbulbifer thermotolerans]